MLTLLIQMFSLNIVFFIHSEKNVFAAQMCGENATWDIKNNTGVLTISGSGDMYDNPSFNILGDYIGTVIINPGITSIGENAFYTSHVSDITIPNTIKSIGEKAFWGCEMLSSLSFPASLTSIGEYTIEKCPSLCSISVDNENKYFSSENGVFYNKDKTKLIVYPAGKSGNTFTIPNSVKSLGVCAFDYCTSLTEINIPASVAKIEYGPFYGSEKLKNINVDTNNKTYASVDGNLYNKQKTTLIKYAPAKTETDFEVPIEVTSIEGYAFAGCKDLTKITISNPKTNINMDEETLPKTATIYGYRNSPAEDYAKENNRKFVALDKNKVEPVSTNTLQKTVKVGKVKGVKIKKLNKKSVKVIWKKVNDVSGYEIQYATSKKFNKDLKKTNAKAKAKSKTIKKLKKKKTYYFRIRAYRKVNGKKVYGSWSKTKKVKIKK